MRSSPDPFDRGAVSPDEVSRTSEIQVRECFKPALSEVSQFFLTVKDSTDGFILIDHIIGEKRQKFRQVMRPTR